MPKLEVQCWRMIWNILNTKTQTVDQRLEVLQRDDQRREEGSIVGLSQSAFSTTSNAVLCCIGILMEPAEEHVAALKKAYIPCETVSNPAFNIGSTSAVPFHEQSLEEGQSEFQSSALPNLQHQPI
ncbi:hypothetical protein C8R41DRAFT_490747 [Lentinula lateritia]|uniref:Uncharacterized protein n=1 Tax=Lentinula lateritia TaxID=40482 RepID=A0ABQ8V939_9AGAR|nr:hypothetical protein C8R41DRAFT_490747 [Lentinula lateritia]